MHFDQHHHHPPQVWKETFSLRMIHIWSLTHIHPEIWSSSSILGHPSASSKIVNLIISDHQHHHWNHYHGSDTINGHPSGAASSNMVYLIIFDHQHHHWNHHHWSVIINGHPSGAASSKIVYLMISSGAITPGTARYLSAEWSCIACIDVLFAKLFVVQRRIGPQLVNG